MKIIPYADILILVVLPVIGFFVGWVIGYVFGYSEGERDAISMNKEDVNDG